MAARQHIALVPLAEHQNSRFIDLSGLQVGRLTVIGPAGRHHKTGAIHWHCRCECGNEIVVDGQNLRKAMAKSCGCLQRDVRRQMNRDAAIHRMSNTPTWHSWYAMRSRCHSPSDQAYGRYGGRGIIVCERWRSSFEKFLEDMGERPSLAHTIDRYPDNNGNYELGNCRWATRREQNRNRRSNRLLTLNGETMCIADWADRLGLTQNSIYCRLRSGWSVEQALAVRKSP